MTAARLAAESALAEVPGWAGADLSPLTGGFNSQAWLVERDGERAVLKLDDAPRSAPFNSRPDEARIQSAAARSGIGSRVIHASETMLLSEYAEGDALVVSSAGNSGALEDLAKALRQIHSLPLTGRKFDAPAAASKYIETFGDVDPVLAESHMRTIREMPAAAELCCCHNDLVPANILSGDGIRFIDWEYACDNDPLFDLATVVVEYRLGSSSAQRLLDVYFDGDGARWHEKLGEQERLYKALAWLWRESQGRI